MIEPRTVDLTIASSPPGLTLGAGIKSEVAPFTVTAIDGSNVGLSAPLAQELSGESYTWAAWSDGGDRVHSVSASEDKTYTATYTPDSGPAEFSLKLIKQGTGKGTVTSAPAGILCGLACDEAAAVFPEGQVTTLSQTPAGGSKFDGWSGCEEETAGACKVTMDEAEEVEASFAEVPIQPEEPSQPSQPNQLGEPSADDLPIVGPPVPPRTRLSGHPSKRTRRTNARFRFSADLSDVVFKCKLDRRRFKRCRSPRVYRNLEPGRHVFRVFATNAGVRDQTPSVFRWRVLPPRRD